MDKITNHFTSIEQVTGEYLRSAKSSRADNSSQASFEEILRKKQNQRSSELKFSKHASMRLEERNISSDRGTERKIRRWRCKSRQKMEQRIISYDGFPGIYRQCSKQDRCNLQWIR